MDVQQLLNQFIGADKAQKVQSGLQQSGLLQPGKSKGIPGGFTGVAAAGGLAALVMGNKKARKMTKKAAKVGGAALLGGLAFQAYRSWQQNNQAQAAQPYSQHPAQPQPIATEQSFCQSVEQDGGFQLTLIKAMIAAAKADGHIDNVEQDRILDAVDKMQLDAAEKGRVLDLLRQPISVFELAQAATSFEQKSELYLISCFAIDVDNPMERQHLQQLEQALALPAGLAPQLEHQANQDA